MSRLIIGLVCLCFGFNLMAQTTFNKRTRFDFEASVLTSVLVTDSCYYATGIIADTVPPFNTGNIFAKLDLMGEPVSVKTLESTEKTYETWESTLIGLEDGGFFLLGYTLDSTMKALLIRYNENGDTLFTKEYLNPAYPSASFIRPMSLSVSGGRLVFVNWLGTAVLGNTNVGMMWADMEGGMISQQAYGNQNRETPISSVTGKNGGVIFGARRTNTNFVTQGYTYQTYITSLDSLGNEEWAYLSHPDSLRDAANDMLLLEDGSLIVASGVGHEIESASVNKVYFDKHVFKLDPQQEIEWELTYPDTVLSGLAKVTNVERFPDGSGFLFAGVATMAMPEPIVGAHMGWFAKVSEEGDSLWTRKYLYLTEGPSRNDIYDLKMTPDGGFIACGEARDMANGATYPQQAWLLKLDGHGCLVPGCEAGDTVVYDAVGQPVRPEMELAIYPNPTTDYLNFQLRGTGGDVGRDALFRVVGAQGRVVREFAAGGRNETYIVPVWDWGSGVYFLQYVAEGRVVLSEKFVVGG